MPVTERTLHVDHDELVALRRPHDDLVLERADGPDRWVCAEGPFTRYERRLAVEPDGDGRHVVAKGVEWELGDPHLGSVVRPLVAKLFRRELVVDGDPDAPAPRPPWWSPPDRLDARASAMVARLCALSLVTGYLGTVLTQTITFAADEFGPPRAPRAPRWPVPGRAWSSRW